MGVREREREMKDVPWVSDLITWKITEWGTGRKGRNMEKL